MKPGRDLDALVAEKVMGLKGPLANFWYETENGMHACLPAYSTDIAAAWEVMEELKSIGSMVQVFFSIGTWRVSWRRQNDPPSITLYATAGAAPHAICLAALQAVGAL